MASLIGVVAELPSLAVVTAAAVAGALERPATGRADPLAGAGPAATDGPIADRG